MTLTPSECASCMESLESRLMRVRGVKAAFHDPEKHRVAIVLDDNNRVRLWRLRGAIEQDGTKVTAVSGRAAGELSRQGEEWRFTVMPGEMYRVKDPGPSKPGRVELSGVIDGETLRIE